MLNSGMDLAHNHQGIRSFFSLSIIQEGTIITNFHGIDRHKKYSLIAVLDRKGEETAFEPRSFDLKEYREKVGFEDEVILKALTGSFEWADRVMKNNIQAVLSENGIHLTKQMKELLLSADHGLLMVDEFELAPDSERGVRSCLELLWRVEEEKEWIRKKILLIFKAYNNHITIF